ncbi:DUF6879 family protein [Streptomyces sp. NPDC049555]|uniref:DUF6879 family protein n=1 Tax=unclassified Streptomyces TaxID=2593676 RepID=UPI003417572E
MPDIVPFEQIAHLFRDFQYTAWRLETQRGYASDRTGDRWQRWLAGKPLGYEPDHPWHANVRRQTQDGKRFERVRIVDVPPTEGQRFLLATAPGNIAAGEDIRCLRRPDAQVLGLPAYDFWLFDSRLLARFHHATDGTTLGVELSEEPTEVLRACRVRDTAWRHAFPADGLQGLV